MLVFAFDVVTRFGLGFVVLDVFRFTFGLSFVLVAVFFFDFGVDTFLFGVTLGFFSTLFVAAVLLLAFALALVRVLVFFLDVFFCVVEALVALLLESAFLPDFIEILDMNTVYKTNYKSIVGCTHKRLS